MIATDAFDRLTWVSMLAPSPDWFVGVSGLPLRDEDGWIPSLTVDLGEPTPDLVADVCRPGWQCPIGVTLNHGWMSDVDFPTAGENYARHTPSPVIATMMSCSCNSLTNSNLCSGFTRA